MLAQQNLGATCWLEDIQEVGDGQRNAQRSCADEDACGRPPQQIKGMAEELKEERRRRETHAKAAMKKTKYIGELEVEVEKLKKEKKEA